MTKIKILFFAANPTTTSPLKLDEEIRAIDAKIRAAEFRDELELELVSAWATRPDDLLQKLLEHRPHVVHFSGHGTTSGSDGFAQGRDFIMEGQPNEQIILVGNDGQPKPVSTLALMSLFKTLKDNVRVVVFNACYSRPHADAIKGVIDCTIGMNTAIGDPAAIVFAASFYRALGYGGSVQDAFDQGKTALMLENTSEENTPELLVRNDVDPTRIVLVGSTGQSERIHPPEAPRASPAKKRALERLSNVVRRVAAFTRRAIWWTALTTVTAFTFMYGLPLCPPFSSNVMPLYVLELVLIALAVAQLRRRGVLSTRKLVKLGTVALVASAISYTYNRYHYIIYPHDDRGPSTIVMGFRGCIFYLYIDQWSYYNDRFTKGDDYTPEAIRYRQMNRKLMSEHIARFPSDEEMVYDYIEHHKDPQWIATYGTVFNLKDRFDDQGIWTEDGSLSPRAVSELFWTRGSLWYAQCILQITWIVVVASYSLCMTALFLRTRSGGKISPGLKALVEPLSAP